MRKQKEEKVVVIFCSDLHLSLTPPIFRSNEPDWLAAQQRPLDELGALRVKYNCPIFCAGDIFDKWNSPAELINWAMVHLPYMHCIPGQHDLPEHDMKQIKRSAYWTLVQSSIISNLLNKDVWIDKDRWHIGSFGFGEKITAPKNENPSIKHIALIHQYNWINGHVYNTTYSDRQALRTQHVDGSRKEFRGYDIVISGDNHSPFSCQIGTAQFINCGTFMRRKADEWAYDPSVWLLRSDGQVVRHPLDTSKDKRLELGDPKIAAGEADTPDLDLSELISGLGKLGKCTLDFAEAMKHHLFKHPTSKSVQDMIYKAME